MAVGLGANGLTIAALGIRGLFPILVARAFGGEILGAWALCWIWIDGLSKLAALGLDSAVTTEIARRLVQGRHGAAAAVARRSIQLGLTCGLIVAGAVIAIAWTAARGSTSGRVFWHTLAVMATALPLLAVRRISNGVSFARLHMRHDLYSRALADAVGFLAVFVPGVALGFGPLTAAVATATGSATSGLTAWRLARKGIRDAAPGLTRPADTRTLLHDSLPIGGYGLLNILLTRLDVLIVGAFVGTPGFGAVSFGVYCAAAEIAGGLRKIRQAFDPIFTPIAARQVARGIGAEQSVNQMGRWTLILTLPVLIALAAAGGSVLALYGPGFRSGAEWLTLLAVANATNGLFAAAENALMLVNPRVNVVNSLLTVGVQSAAVFVFGLQWGLMGAAAAVLLASLLHTVLRLGQLSRRVAWRWRWDSWVAPATAGVAGLLAALAARSFRSSTSGDLVAAAIGIAVYIVTLRRLGLDAEDASIFAALRKGLR